jgi:mannitol-1-/sugar-/sorbitol-6-phosphatase
MTTRRKDALAAVDGPMNQARAVIACDALLFDMDGTLVDSTAVVERHWAAWASRNGLDLAEILRVSHGRPTIETLRLIAPQLATVEEAARLDAEEAGDSDGLRAVVGARELLASLPSDRWAVVTSAGRALATRRLRTALVPVPNVLVTPDDVLLGKPNPMGYVEAARRLGAAISRSIVIEDAPVGIEAGRAAGAIVIGVTTTFPTLPGCDYVIRNLRALRLIASTASGLRVEVNG